ncbi:striatin-3 [Trichonephila clavipes]|nr:striatin-3 [Trichonephila clavipes]
MEDVSATQNHSVQLGLPSGGIGINSKQSQDDCTQRPHYSIPGILHFIQHEWARFELERAQWEVERAELQESPHPWRQTEKSAKTEQDGAKCNRQWQQGYIAG